MDLVEIKTDAEIAIMRRAGKVVAETLQYLGEMAVPGISTKALASIAEECCLNNKVLPAFKGYLGFPSSICISINEEIVHGIPSERTLCSGDLVKLDFGVFHDGFYADAAITVTVGDNYFPVKTRDLIHTTQRCLNAAISKMVPGATLLEVSSAIADIAEASNFFVPTDFSGHGIGRLLHESPVVPNYRDPEIVDLVLKPGMVFAIEPILMQNSPDVKLLKDRWTAVAKHGGLSAHFEHTVAVTKTGPKILTLV